MRGYQYPYRSDGNDNYFAEVTWFENCPAFGIYTFKNPKSNFIHLRIQNQMFVGYQKEIQNLWKIGILKIGK